MARRDTGRRVDLDALLNTEFESIGVSDAIATLGVLVDAGSDAGSAAALTRATEIASVLRGRPGGPHDEVLLHYFEGNAWWALHAIRRRVNEDSAWEWEAPELDGKIIALRRARTSAGFERLPVARRCQILTNLGGALAFVGRTVEALVYWDEALELDSGFAMALAAKGDALWRAIAYLYDDGHQQVYAKLAFENTSRALTLPLETPEVERRLRATLHDLESRAPPGFFDDPVTLPATSLGKTKAETAYRRWCVERRLFLNPMNDVLKHEAVTHDILNLPTLHGPIDEMRRARRWIRLFNSMKQEYIAARLLAYEAETASSRHFADREVQLANALDDTVYGLSVERSKIAFRLAYSILDKVGFFVNDYFRLGVGERQVSFRTIWYERGRLRPLFVGRRNQPLRGLFWLSKDLDARSYVDLHNSLDPDARGLADLRNALEHRYVRSRPHTELPEADPLGVGTTDEAELVISVAELRAKALKMLRKARAAMINLSLAVRVEQRRADDQDERLAWVIDPPPLRHATE